MLMFRANRFRKEMEITWNASMENSTILYSKIGTRDTCYNREPGNKKKY